MKYKYDYGLSEQFGGCPPAWRNFINSFDDSDLRGGEATLAAINRELKNFNGRYRGNDSDPSLQFITEEDVTVFILRWS
jgi:hypothetical protein